MSYIVTVTGERDWSDRETIYRVLDEELDVHRDRWFEAHRDEPDFDESAPECATEMLLAFTLRHGVAEGADWIANDWGKERRVTIERFPAQWRDHTGYHPEAGPIRNRKMAAADPRANKCCAFWSGRMRKTGNREYSGTLDMMKCALQHGIPLRVEPPRTI